MNPFVFDISNRIMEKHGSNIIGLAINWCDIYNALHLARLTIDRKGIGTGSAVMQMLTDYADENCLDLILEAVAPYTPHGEDGLNAQDRLFLFYQRFGFRHGTANEASLSGVEAGFMIREHK